MNDALLVFEDVALDGPYGGRLSLTVPPNQSVSIVGGAASGVNRLAPLAMGLGEMSGGGHALLLGKEVGAMSRHAALAFRRKVGYVPAGDGLLQNLSLADNIALPLRFGSAMSEREIEGRLRVMLVMARIDRAALLRPAAVDVEQRRRAAFARALAFDPDLVILDHPFDGITGRAATELLELARGGETARGGRRTVFITGQYLPDRLRSRIERRYRLVHGELQTEP